MNQQEQEAEDLANDKATEEWKQRRNREAVAAYLKRKAQNNFN